MRKALVEIARGAERKILTAITCVGLAVGLAANAAAQTVPAGSGLTIGPALENLPSLKDFIAVPKASPEEPNFGLVPPNTRYNVSGLGPLSGEWTIGGAVDAFAALARNPTPTLSGTPGSAGTLSLLEGVITIEKKSGPLQFTYWGGAWQTPAQGIVSDFGPFNSLARFGSPTNPFPSGPTFKWWLTWQPSSHFAVSGGEMHSLMGTEIGFDYFNPTILVSELNNLQATPGYGPEVHFFEGPLEMNIQYSDAYHTGRVNYVSSNLVWRMNDDDFLLAYGGENAGHSGEPGKGFALRNSSLIGIGAQFIVGRWLISPEAQYQWLPKNSVTQASGLPRPQVTYHNVALMADLVYQFSEQWSLAGQVQYVFQNNDRHDPNAAVFGNWLQFGFPAAPGVFSAGTSLSGLQIVPTWQRHRLFVRGDLSFVHIAGFANGTGYGPRGEAPNHLAALLEVGFLI